MRNNIINWKAIVGAFLISILAACAHQNPWEPMIVDSDLAFDFGSATLTEPGKKKIDTYMPSIINYRDVRLEIVGHSDRIGNDSANQRLSEQRAQAVANHILATTKLKADQIRVRGLGPRDPIVQCNQSNRQALIDCLAPNRRVEIRVTELVP